MCKKEKMKDSEHYKNLWEDANNIGYLPEECDIIAEKAFIEEISCEDSIKFLKKKKILL